MKTIIKRNLSGRKILILVILTNVIYVLMLSVTIPKVTAVSRGMKLLDMMPAGYTPEYVNSLLKELGETGRNAYLYNQIPLDMIYPLLFAITYCLLLAYLFKKLGKLDSNVFYLALIPIFSGLFDYLENTGVIVLLKTYPENPLILSQITSVFSVLKSFSATIYFIILIISFIVFGIKKLKSKKEIA